MINRLFFVAQTACLQQIDGRSVLLDMLPTQTIELTEFGTVTLARTALTDVDARLVEANYGGRLLVIPPSYQTHDRWVLKAQGWIGHMPLTSDLMVVVTPKVDINNVFRMLEYVYDIDMFLPQRGTQVATLLEFYDRLAQLLAERVLRRCGQGVYRAYERREDRLYTVRGRLNMRAMAQQQLDVMLPCAYEEFSADTPHNQIIHWTLHGILRTGLCTPETQHSVRHAYNLLNSLVTPTPFAAAECVGRSYTRLNGDYRPMHLLCRFFLDNSGPAHLHGEVDMLPFAINMAALFEKFVACWLQCHLPTHLTITAQERRTLDNGALSVNIDLVLRNRASGRVLAVLDTKYKADKRPSPNDIYQIDSYADIMDTSNAVLIYPEPFAQPLSTRHGHVHVRSVCFDLSGNLEESGQQLLTQLHLHVADVSRRHFIS